MYSGLQQSRPLDVTPTNWEELKTAGLEWLTNLGWPLDDQTTTGLDDQTDEDYVFNLRREYGQRNVLLGLPCNHDGMPDAEFHRTSNLIGVYTKRR